MTYGDIVVLQFGSFFFFFQENLIIRRMMYGVLGKVIQFHKCIFEEKRNKIVHEELHANSGDQPHEAPQKLYIAVTLKFFNKNTALRLRKYLHL